MNLVNYDTYKKNSRILIIAGVGMMFENIKYANIIGIIMITIGFIINHYYDKKKMFEKEIIIKFIEENINKDIIKEPIVKEPINKEIKVINTFGKKYNINNNIVTKQQIDPSDHINNNNIDYDKITLFLDLYMFVKKYELIMNNIEYNKLLNEYYKYYYNVIAYISNLNNTNDVSNALDYLMYDYNNNSKQLNNIIKELYPNYSIINIKSILIIFNEIIYSEKN